MTIGQGRDSNSDGTASPQSSPRPQRVKVRDPRWLQVQVCQDFIAHKCPRTEDECAYAHPPANCIVEAGKVTACFDAMKVCIESILSNFPAFLTLCSLPKPCESRMEGRYEHTQIDLSLLTFPCTVKLTCTEVKLN